MTQMAVILLITMVMMMMMVMAVVVLMLTLIRRTTMTMAGQRSVSSTSCSRSVQVLSKADAQRLEDGCSLAATVQCDRAADPDTDHGPKHGPSLSAALVLRSCILGSLCSIVYSLSSYCPCCVAA